MKNKNWFTTSFKGRKIRFVWAELKNNIEGLWQPLKTTDKIIIDPNYSKESILSTVLHEALHVVEDRYGVIFPEQEIEQIEKFLMRCVKKWLDEFVIKYDNDPEK
jgi:hypothetical protein